jgi:hypothetical protein
MLERLGHDGHRLPDPVAKSARRRRLLPGAVASFSAQLEL